MIHSIASYRWDRDLQEFVRVPLDDDEPIVIQVSRQFVGSAAPASEVARLLERGSLQTI